ncbi:hypothetical protein BGZ80_011747 [Entomortierella chlamydospora]|uniref:Uncharacterized protein n=1 Tax=Entomortierella chlamydospora TaxID=101097 RepID=A0A9P6MTE4_9FUNG|nr:hypothetical protein BGZ80_011747 [Entomortierella chlamydospora]
MAAARGTAKVLQKLEKSVGAGNYYEAHQMYRTVANRYVKAQNYKDAIDLLHSGSLLLLKHNQAGSGADLGLYLIEVYNLDKVPVTEESRDRIFDIADLMGPENSQRKSFLQNAIKYVHSRFVAPAAWSASNGEYNNGDPLIQHYVGLLYWKEKNYEQAEQHLLVGTKESAEALGLVLFEWSEVTPTHDKGAYLLRGVLQELSMRNLRDANVLYKTFKSPLLNLTQLLLLTCGTGNASLFKQISAKYKPVLSIDENFGHLMTTIGELFFGIKPVRQPNMLADLMSSLFSGPPPSQQPAIAAGSPRPPQPAIEEMD